MGLIAQQRALDAAGGLRQLLTVVRKHDKALFDQMATLSSGVDFDVRRARLTRSR